MVLNNIYYLQNGLSFAKSVQNGTTVSNVVGKSMTQLSRQYTYPRFDFNKIWVMGSNWPILKNFMFVYVSQLETAEEVTVSLGKEKQLDVLYKPVNATVTHFTYSSSSNRIVSVDEKGIITGNSIGEAVITVKTTDGGNKTKEILVKVILGIQTDDYEIINDAYIKMNSFSKKEDVLKKLVEDNTGVGYHFEFEESSSENIATGDNLLVYDQSDELLKTYIISVLGDVTGSGDIKVSDVAKMYQYVKNVIEMNNEYQIAADVTGDGSIKVNDVAKLYQYIKGNIESLED